MAPPGAQQTDGDELAGPHGRWHAVQAPTPEDQIRTADPSARLVCEPIGEEHTSR